MDDMDNLLNLKELLDNLCIKFGEEELFISDEPKINNLPRPPATIKKDISRAKTALEARNLNIELDRSYKYYNNLSRETRNKIEREQKLINKVHRDLQDLREFMTDEEYQTVFEEEYKLEKAEETKEEIEKWFNNAIKFKIKEEV